MSKMMVILWDSLTGIIKKGDIRERYYNPSNAFSEVHIVLTGDENPDPAIAQKMVGDAKLFIHNKSIGGLFARTLGWRPFLLENWARGVVELAREIRPSLVQCHHAHLNAFAGYVIKRELGIPYVVRVHINPDVDIRGRASTVKEKMVSNAIRTVEKIALTNADMVLPVYAPIVPFLKSIGVTKYEVAYNVIAPNILREKTDYTLHDPVRLISVGRQFPPKNPENVIKALADIPNAHYTLFGDGECHQHLKKVAGDCGVSDRVEFIRCLPNAQLCAMLPDFDIFVTHTEYWEISQAVLEPLLTGLPVLLNKRIGAPVPELTEDICMLVPNTIDDYKKALRKLIGDHDFRQNLGETAKRHARSKWSPEITEKKFADIYSGIALK